MAPLTFCPVLSSSSVLSRTTPNLVHTTRTQTRTRSGTKAVTLAASSSSEDSDKSTKLVTFLGKGGSGKTTSAIFAAQHYAMAGFSTCLVIHTQDPTAEFLLSCKIGTSPVLCSENLSALRFETTRMLLGPLKQLKQADARLNMTQGVLEGIFGEELGVLPGMDPIFSALALERLVGFFGNVAQRNHNKDKFDIIVYDGMSSEEMLRMISAAGKARLYLKYLRNVADKTDFGRMAGPSLLRLVDEAMSLTNSTNLFNGNRSADIWNSVEKMLERGSSAFSEPQKFGCFLVLDPNNPASISSALRYWGCTIQAGGQISAKPDRNLYQVSMMQKIRSIIKKWIILLSLCSFFCITNDSSLRRRSPTKVLSPQICPPSSSTQPTSPTTYRESRCFQISKQRSKQEDVPRFEIKTNESQTEAL